MILYATVLGGCVLVGKMPHPVWADDHRALEF